MQPFTSTGQPRPSIGPFKPFYVEYAYFTSILGFSNDHLLRERIHEMENMLEDGELHFIYDRTYGDIKFGIIHGLIPYYKLLNQLFHYTLCPKGGDSDNISNMFKNLLARMAPNQNEFSVFDFIWKESIICLVSPNKSCHYAPYIFSMIKEVTIFSYDPSSSQGHSSSHGPPPRAPKKKGMLRFVSQGLFACFNVGRHNA
jgi:hypothetical protein